MFTQQEWRVLATLANEKVIAILEEPDAIKAAVPWVDVAGKIAETLAESEKPAKPLDAVLDDAVAVFVDSSHEPLGAFCGTEEPEIPCEPKP
jgi:hypothetical protein